MPLVAFTTLALLREPYGSARVQGFFDRMASVYAGAETFEGFVARSVRDDSTGQHNWGESTPPRFVPPGQHPCLARTLSLWVSVECIAAFVYQGVHGQALMQRLQWFVPPVWPTHAAWWVPDDHIPQWHEANDRLERLHERGPGPLAFTLGRAFAADGTMVEVDRAEVQRIAGRATVSPSGDLGG